MTATSTPRASNPAIDVSVFNSLTTAKRVAQAAAPAAPTAPAAPIHTASKVKVTPLAYVEASTFQVAVFKCAFSTGDAINKVVESARAKMLGIVRAQYGDVSPTYAQFKNDRVAFQALALERGLVDDQVIRKPYCAAIVELFGSLPVSDSPAAVAKRAQRPVAEKAVKVPATPAERPVSPSDVIGQFIATHGAAAVLVELAKILATEKSTQTDARTLVAVASHLAA